MPSFFARLGREKTLPTLVKRLFVFGGAGQADALRVAEAAVLRANPGLDDPAGFTPGRVVVVPADIGLTTTSRVEAPVADVGGALGTAGLRLELAGQLISDGFASGDETGKETLARLKDPAFAKTLQKLVPESKDLAARAADGVSLGLQMAGASKAQLDQALPLALAEIEKLKKIAAPQSGSKPGAARQGAGRSASAPGKRPPL